MSNDQVCSFLALRPLWNLVRIRRAGKAITIKSSIPYGNSGMPGIPAGEKKNVALPVDPEPISTGSPGLPMMSRVVHEELEDVYVEVVEDVEPSVVVADVSPLHTG